MAEQNEDSSDQREYGHQNAWDRQRRKPSNAGEDQPDREQKHSRAACYANGHELHLQTSIDA